MGFRYLNKVASPEHIKEFLELADLAAGAGEDAGNVFELSRRLSGNPMSRCLRRLQQDPAAAALIQSRKLCGPYNVAAMKQLPKGSLGHTYATVMEALGYDIDFFPDPAFYKSLESDGDYVITASTPPTISTTSSAATASTTLVNWVSSASVWANSASRVSRF